MRLRSLIDLVPFFPLILAQTSSSSSHSGCRCTYGSSCWPSSQDFAALASGLSQPLIHPVPPASACYPTKNPSGNCTEVRENFRNSNWRSSIPGAYENINFEEYVFKNGSISACYLNTTLGHACGQGSVPPVGVDARTVEDIQAAVKFAAKHNLKIVVKNTGHDYLGRSAGRGSFMIWTHNLKNVTYDGKFIPEGGSSSESTPAITLSAGVNWGEAYAAVTQNNRFLVGGLSVGMSVGASGGWIQGGGHSAFSPSYGLGVDNALQFNIVLPSGSHITTNGHLNSDLFWALRGGGAGSWGVITSVTYKTHDIFPLTMAGLNVTFSPQENISLPLIAEFIKLQPKLSDLGWGGYSSFSNSSLSAFWVAPNVSWAQTNETILPFFDFARNITGQPNLQAISYPFDNFASWLNATFGIAGAGGASQVGGNVLLASRLLSRDAAEEGRAGATAKLLLDMGPVSINSISGGFVSRVDPDSVGLNPGWRKSVAMVFTTGTWESGDSAQVINQTDQQIINDVRRLEPISPDSATYMNEASIFEPDFRKSFFGSHYKKLRAIKRKYDPSSLFIVTEGVGSEDWNKDLTCPVRLFFQYA